MTDADAKRLRELAADCRRLVYRSYDFQMRAELNEIADALIAKAGELGAPPDILAERSEDHSDSGLTLARSRSRSSC